MHRTRNSLAKVIGVAVPLAACAALGAGVAQAEPAAPGVGGMLGSVSVAKGALQNSPVSPARQSGQSSTTSSSETRTGPNAMVAGLPLTRSGMPLGLGG